MLNKPRCDLHARLAFSCVAATAFAACASAQTDCYYSWEEIRVNGGICLAWDINNLGHVVGEIDTGGDSTRAFLWTPETGVGVLPFPDGVYSMSAYAINDSGQVAGYLENGIEPLGFVWQVGVGYSVIDPPNPRANMYITDINNHGQVVGSVYRRTPPGPWHWDPFIWENGTLTVLSGLAGSTSLFSEAINELGDIAGRSIDAMGLPQAVLITDRSVVTWLPLPPGFNAARVHDINNTGTIVGYGYVPEPFHFEAIVWSDSGIHVISPGSGERDSILRDINDSGRAVGYYYGGPDERPIVWQFGEAAEIRPMVSSPPFQIPRNARAINEQGQIAVLLSSYSLRLTPHWLEGDLTGDCHVGLEDLAVLLSEFGAEPSSYIGADVNHDGQLDLTDLAMLLSNFGI